MQLKINSARARVTVLWQHAQNHEVIMFVSTAPSEKINWIRRKKKDIRRKKRQIIYRICLYTSESYIYIYKHMHCCQGTHSSVIGSRLPLCVLSPSDSQQSITFCFALYVCICHILTPLSMYCIFCVWACVHVCVFARAGECVSAGDALTIPTPYSAPVSSESGAAYIRTGQK